MHSVFALLIGINGYRSKPLQGCINDVEAMEDYLQTMFGRRTDTNLRIKKLTDAEGPTRQNVIEAFDFFNDASGADHCLIYYSGHGSFSPAPKQFWNETDGFNESLVCIDSREGSRDLMDKEISFLLWKTFRNKPEANVVFITDCCHSGTITRALNDCSEITDRMMTASSFPVSVEDYYGFNEEFDGERGYVVSEDGGEVTVKTIKHLHLSASQDNQTAKELVIEGKRRGAFTYSLLKALHTTSSGISYQELIDRANIMVRNIVSAQNPGLSVYGSTTDGSERKKKFLLPQDADIQPRYLVFKHPEAGWCVKAGLLHGVSEGDLVLIEGLDLTTKAGKPFGDFTPIDFKGQGASQFFYAWVILTLNNILNLSFEEQFPEAVRTLLEKSAADQKFPFISFTEGAGRYILRWRNNEVMATLPGKDRPIFKPAVINDAQNAKEFLAQLDILSKWIHLVELANRETKLNKSHYTLQLLRSVEADNYNSKTFTESELKPVNDFPYLKKGTEWYEPAFSLSFTNNSDTDLWFACAYMQFNYGILGSYFSSVRVPAGKTKFLTPAAAGADEKAILLNLDKKYQYLGYKEITEYLKIFISMTEFKTSDLSQDGLELAKLRVGNRGIGSERSTMPGRYDWTTETIGLRIIRPGDVTGIAPGTATSIEGGLIIEPHDLAGKAILRSSVENTRSADEVPPPHTAKRNSQLEPFDLIASERSDKVMDILDLFEVENPRVVTPDNPLVIVPMATRSAEADDVIPVGYDPETQLYYPLGHADDKGRIIINTLPEETPINPLITEKSIGGSIKIYFMKVIGRRLGLGYDYPRLAIAGVENGGIKYERNQEEIQRAVKEAKRVVLFIHGIIGNTEGMLESALTMSGNGKIVNCADLVLSFDYENLNTTIEETAGMLKEALAKAGFSANDEKLLVVVAHSMGGLVSRWMIEQLKGHELVDKLIMYGTPNNGTPWADVRDMAETLLTFALNGAAFLKPWMFLISGLGKLVKGVQVTLKQMDPEGELYRKLNEGRDPGIPYFIIAGNTRNIIVDYEKTTTLIGKLFTKLKKRGVYDLLDAVLFRKPNDIAVSGESIRTLKGMEGWRPAPVVHEASCDHLNYFLTKEAFERICF